MNGEEKEILVEILDSHLPKLTSLYQEKAEWAPYMVSFVHMVMKWKESEKYKNHVKLFSPNNCWELDGTIIAIITIVSQDIVVFTLENQCINLYEGLSKTNLITYGGTIRTVFYAAHEKHVPMIKKHLENKEIRISYDIPCFIYAIPPEEAIKFTIECPPNVCIKKLDPSAAKEINEVWPHKFPNSDQYLGRYIEINGGYGIFLEDTNEMVAWVIKHAFGHLAMLQTKDEHKRKGYASLVTRALSKEIAEEGHWPLGTILLENKQSVTMFQKLGFKCIGICNFVCL